MFSVAHERVNRMPKLRFINIAAKRWRNTAWGFILRIGTKRRLRAEGMRERLNTDNCSQVLHSFRTFNILPSYVPQILFTAFSGLLSVALAPCLKDSLKARCKGAKRMVLAQLGTHRLLLQQNTKYLYVCYYCRTWLVVLFLLTGKFFANIFSLSRLK